MNAVTDALARLFGYDAPAASRPASPRTPLFTDRPAYRQIPMNPALAVQPAAPAPAPAAPVRNPLMDYRPRLVAPELMAAPLGVSPEMLAAQPSSAVPSRSAPTRTARQAPAAAPAPAPVKSARTPLFADRKAYRQIPLDHSKQYQGSNAPAAIVAGAKGAARVVGEAGVFASSDAANQSVKAGINDRLARGDVAGAVGRGFGGAVQSAIALADDVVGRPLVSLGRGLLAADSAVDNAAVSFGRGVLGLGPASATAVASQAPSPSANGTPAKVVNPTPEQTATRQAMVQQTLAADAGVTNPVGSALAQGRAAGGTPITPQEALAGIITQALQGGASFNEIKELGALVPAATATPKQGQTAKDKAFGVNAAINDSIYEAQLAAARKLPEGDARDKAFLDATETYRKNYASLNGVNLAQVAQANLYPDEVE